MHAAAHSSTNALLVVHPTSAQDCGLAGTAPSYNGLQQQSGDLQCSYPACSLQSCATGFDKHFSDRLARSQLVRALLSAGAACQIKGLQAIRKRNLTQRPQLLLPSRQVTLVSVH